MNGHAIVTSKEHAPSLIELRTWIIVSDGAARYIGSPVEGDAPPYITLTEAFALQVDLQSRSNGAVAKTVRAMPIDFTTSIRRIVVRATSVITLDQCDDGDIRELHTAVTRAVAIRDSIRISRSGLVVAKSAIDAASVR